MKGKTASKSKIQIIIKKSPQKEKMFRSKNKNSIVEAFKRAHSNSVELKFKTLCSCGKFPLKIFNKK